MAEAKDFLDAQGKWICTACGACCKSAGLSREFPRQWVNNKGGCKQQTTKGKCRIYENRPPYCRVENTLKGFSDLQKAGFCAELYNFEESRRVRP
jgi:Fe-S-cluster containining protein